MERLIFDSHAHYDDAAFDADRTSLLAALPDRGVGGVINAGCDLVSSRASVALAQRWDFVYAAVGWHPENAAAATPESLAALQQLYDNPRVVAVGEIGLDYHYEDACPRAQQLACFEQQLAFAARRRLPVVIHDREAHEDTLRLLRRYRPQGVLHCFSGSVEMMREVVELGLFIGLGGAVTFRNAKKPVAVAAAVPLDRLLLETDCPYMAPEPHRGQRCDSSLIPYVAAHIGRQRGLSADEVLAMTRDNARRLFSL